MEEKLRFKSLLELENKTPEEIVEYESGIDKMLAERNKAMLHPQNAKIKVSDPSLWHVYCPGCKTPHVFRVKGPRAWTVNSVNPLTVSPSLLVTAPGRDSYRCHSFIKNGVWEFLGDCSHDLKGTKVPMVDLPDYMKES